MSSRQNLLYFGCKIPVSDYDDDGDMIEIMVIMMTMVILMTMSMKMVIKAMTMMMMMMMMMNDNDGVYFPASKAVCGPLMSAERKSIIKSGLDSVRLCLFSFLGYSPPA